MAKSRGKTKHEIREVFIHSIAEQYKNHGERIPSWLHIGDIEFEIEEQASFNPMVEIDLDYVIKQKYIEREVLDKIRAEIEHYAELGDVGFTKNLIPKDTVLQIIDKYIS